VDKDFPFPVTWTSTCEHTLEKNLIVAKRIEKDFLIPATWPRTCELILRKTLLLPRVQKKIFPFRPLDCAHTNTPILSHGCMSVINKPTRCFSPINPRFLVILYIHKDSWWEHHHWNCTQRHLCPSHHFCKLLFPSKMWYKIQTKNSLFKICQIFALFALRSFALLITPDSVTDFGISLAEHRNLAFCPFVPRIDWSKVFCRTMG